MSSDSLPSQTIRHLQGFQSSLDTYAEQQHLDLNNYRNLYPQPIAVYGNPTSYDCVGSSTLQLSTSNSSPSDLEESFDGNDGNFSDFLDANPFPWPPEQVATGNFHSMAANLHRPVTTRALTNRMALGIYRGPTAFEQASSDDCNPIADASTRSRKDTRGIAPCFSCSVCNKMFKRLCDLNTHLKQHSKPYVCSICSRGFSSNKDRNRHELTHSSLMKFRCLSAGCSFETTRKDSFTRHAYNQHMEMVLT